MLEITPHNAIAYLRQRSDVSVGGSDHVELLGWGVSNVVLRICSANGDFVVKQSRELLRTRAEWRSRLERVYREAEVMRSLSEMLPAGTVPQVLFEDRANYLFAMQAIEADHRVWKAELLSGIADVNVASQAADVLATIHGRTAGNEPMRNRWQEPTVFDELRLDPFYRFAAARYPETSRFFDSLIRETLSTPACLVLGDFSPKNILLTSRGIALVDFETACYSDPAFDLGFFLSHLLLKTVLHADRRDAFLKLPRRFWSEYRTRLRPPNAALSPANLSRRSALHLLGCMLARIDGKSPVDYLTEPNRHQVRRFALRLIAAPPESPQEVFRQLAAELK